MSQPILVSVEAGVQTITLNRPERLNAFNPEMHGLLREALERAGDDDAIRTVLLTGAGRGFCAGQDLSERNVGDDAAIDLSVTIESLYNPLVRRLRALPKPIVCAVNGVAAGAGANVALACDIVLAARSASFIQAFAKIGLVPDSGGTWLLPRLAGRARAMGLALLGDKADLSIDVLVANLRRHLDPVAEGNAYLADLIARGTVDPDDPVQLGEYMQGAMAASERIFQLLDTEEYDGAVYASGDVGMNRVTLPDDARPTRTTTGPAV